MKATLAFPARFRFEKRGKVRFISHRDVARAFDRAVRACRLPVAFTQGFTPRPRMSFGLALPVGSESDAEYLDVAFDESVDLGPVSEAMSESLPEGMTVTGSTALAERAPALQESVRALEYTLEVVDDRGDAVAAEELVASIDAFVRRREVLVERTRKGRRRVDDIRPAVRRVAIAAAADGRAFVDIEVSTNAPSARPDEVVAALRDGWGTAYIRRTKQWIERDGARLEPLEADTRPTAEVAGAA